jgi:hypothetical protein
MTPTFKVELAGLNKAVENAMLVTKKTLAEQINQTAFNVAARGFHYTKPNTWDDANAIFKQRNKISGYLKQQMSDARRQGAGAVVETSGNGNRFGSRHKRASRQLRRMTLIAQAAFYKAHGYGIGKGKSNKRTKRLSTHKNAKAGKTITASDYGQAMTAYTGMMLRRNLSNVGYLKTIWMGAIDRLAPFVKFKGYLKNFNGLAGLRRMGGTGYGGASMANENTPQAVVTGLLTAAERKKFSGSSQREIDNAARNALNDEAREMKEHLDRQLTKALK